MASDRLRALEAKLWTSRSGSAARVRRGKRAWLLEGLEDRLLLSGDPTIYTVNAITDTGAGSGTTGDLRYVINQANSDPNTAGSEIEFDPSVFNSSSPQTITLASTLTLSESAGPEVIVGPGASALTVSGNNEVEVFSVVSGVTANLSALAISGGVASQGGGISVVGGVVSLTSAAVINNQAVGGPTEPPAP